jgi:hypothetical protein
MHCELNVLALVKGKDKYVFLFDDSNRVETLRMLGRYAADPELNFSWYDAAMLSQRIREMAALEQSTQNTIHESKGERTAPRFRMPAPEDL